jgi:hypothetical protein
MTAAASPDDAPARRRRARGLTLWAIVAVALSPFSLATFGAGFFLGGGLIAVSLILERRGLRARGPLVAGIVAVASSLAFAGACGWLVFRTAEVTGRDEARQDRVERRFDRAFDAAGGAPTSSRSSRSSSPPASRAPPTGAEHSPAGDDAGAVGGADSPGGDGVDAGRAGR